ncbi:YqjD family protein [Daeguia caeni]|uniref:YqjD family protein n=1 Tax=Daeguia caeni TaxID=439612 RepID=A0ABV9H7H0_9HYPH
MARAASKIKELNDTAEDGLKNSDAETLQKQIEQLKQDIAAIAATLGNIGSATVQTASQSARKSYESAYAQGEDVADALKNKALDLETQLTEAVRERPLTALATALGIGYILAKLSRR